MFNRTSVDQADPTIALPGNSPTGSDPVLVADFLSKMPQCVVELGRLLRAFLRSTDNATKHTCLLDLQKDIRILGEDAAAAGLAVLTQKCALIDSYLQETSGKPDGCSAAAMRTLTQAIDGLRLLSEKPAEIEPLCTSTQAQVLVVDDDRIGRLAVVKSIQRLGLSVREAADAETALICLREASADLIVLDVNMPGMSGFDLCVAIRALPGHKLTPIIFVTRLDDFESRSKSILVGGGELITKPFSFTELSLKALTHLLKGRLNRAAGDSKTGLAGEQSLSDPQPAVRSRSAPASIPVPGIAPESPHHASSNALPSLRTEAKSSAVHSSVGSRRRTPATKRTGTHGVITMDAEWVIESINGPAGELFGYRALEVTGKRIDILLVSELAEAFKQLAAQPSSAEPPDQTTGRWIIGRRSDGAEFPAHWVVKDIMIGGVSRKTAIFRDAARWCCVSERRIKREFSERLEDAADQLAQLQAELTQARSVAARTPPSSANRSQFVPGQAALEERIQSLLAQQTKTKAQLDKETASHAEATQLAQDYAQSAAEMEERLACQREEATATLQAKELEWAERIDATTREAEELRTSLQQETARRQELSRQLAKLNLQQTTLEMDRQQAQSELADV